MNLLKHFVLIFTIALFSASSYASHCGGGHTHDHKKMAEKIHDHKKMAEKKGILKKSDTEENVEVSIASNSEDEAAEDQDSDSETETR
tara:strand:- start:247 stop:510 length:264 start_codon:yes stop_codon:yes gene_type:complete